MSARDATVWDWPKEFRQPVESRFHISPKSNGASSPWTGARSIYGPISQAWNCELTFPQISGDNVQRIEGFITRMRGIAGKLRLVDYFRQAPLYHKHATKTTSAFSDSTLFSDSTGFEEGGLPPSCVVDALGVEGADSLVLKSLPTSITNILEPGDRFELRPNGIPTAWGNYYEITDYASTNAAGNTRIYFQPGLRQNIAAGDQVVLLGASCVVALADDAQGIMNRMFAGPRGNFGLSLVEVLRDDG